MPIITISIINYVEICSEHCDDKLDDDACEKRFQWLIGYKIGFYKTEVVVKIECLLKLNYVICSILIFPIAW